MGVYHNATTGFLKVLVADFSVRRLLEYCAVCSPMCNNEFRERVGRTLRLHSVVELEIAKKCTPPPIRKNPREFGPVTIEPNGMERIALGRYRDAGAEPRFAIQYEPDVENNIVHKPIKIGDGTIYILSYQVQNFGDAPVTVTARRIN